MAKVLVTGGAGFLGSHIADILTGDGHDVTIFDQVPSRWRHNKQNQIVGSITDPEAVRAAVKGMNTVFHLAAIADLNAARKLPLQTAQTNILGTIHLLNAAVEWGVSRFLFGSTVYVYSNLGGFYKCSKQACENYIEEFNAQFGLSYTILRYGSLYGPRADETNGVFRLLKQYLTFPELEYSGSEDERREYIHVQDAARLSANALTVDFENRHLVITGQDRLKITELFDMFGEIIGKKTPIRFTGSSGETTGHYKITPYTFTPRLGKKLVPNEYVDMGQGILKMIEEFYGQMES